LEAKKSFSSASNLKRSGPQTLAQTWIIGIVAPQWDDAPGQAFNGAKRLPAQRAQPPALARRA